jgi:hypothetical protein
MGKAGILATEVTITARTLRFIYTNITHSDLRLMMGPSDIPYNQEVSEPVGGWAAAAPVLRHSPLL